MGSTIVYDHVAEGTEVETGRLFEGKKFFVAQRMFGRTALLDLIKANGGEITILEKHADWMIADHVHKNCAPGTISYEFVHKSVKQGEILDPDNFLAGPRLGTARAPGSLQPAKGTRNAYTPDEDRMLYKWVKDAEASGVAVSGNELYKQLEQKNPRHTWQSWRDRYLKHLKTRTPSAFNIPHNAPPSPPSDQSSRAPEPPVVKRSGLVKNKDKARAVTVEERATSIGTAPSKEEYTVEQLAATFDTSDWEKVYAYVEELDSFREDDAAYQRGWRDWAANEDNQTAEQWRQYYEKIVRPQWLQDPPSKRQQIRKRVEERTENESTSPTNSQTWSQTQVKVVGASQIEEEVPKQPSKPTAPDALASDSRLESESTAQQETPKYLKDGYESALKRIRGEVDDATVSAESPRPTKMRRTSPMPMEPGQTTGVVGTKVEPLDISSAESSQQASTEVSEEITQAVILEQAAQVSDGEDDVESVRSVSSNEFPHPGRIRRSPPTAFGDEDDEDDEDDDQSIASSTDITHIVPLPRPPRIPESTDSEDSEDSNLSTPRGPRPTTFDTQAILSSPSQLPSRLPALPHALLDSSPPHHPDSEASTTQSIEEFRHSLTTLDNDTSTQPRPLPRPTSPTPSTTSTASTTTSTSSTHTTDPDPPLTAAEIPLFFTEQNAHGFSDTFISKALQRTTFRPVLATVVLDAWREGRPLPSRRGIWSREDDEIVESGDGRALQQLKGRHGVDGWGGIMERGRWLRAWRG